MKSAKTLRGWSRQVDRKRKNVIFTLSDEARAALAVLAPVRGKSAFVERLILDARERSLQ